MQSYYQSYHVLVQSRVSARRIDEVMCSLARIIVSRVYCTELFKADTATRSSVVVHFVLGLCGA